MNKEKQRRGIFPAFPDTGEIPTNSQRDLALDAVRSWSLFVVVFGHFIMQILFWDGDIPAGGNTLSSGRPWPYVTWILQVMPLFFVAGGAVNIGSFARAQGHYNEWLWQRVRRLMKPTAVYLLTMALAFSVITLIVDQEITDPLCTGITGPLWFLAVYIAVTALTPITSRWWNRWGLKSIVALICVVAVVDSLRLQVFDAAGTLNLIVAWVLVHQFGYWYQSGVTNRQAQALIAIGLGANILITQVLRWYPTSLVGIPTEAFSNMAPPTIVLVFHSMVLFGLFVRLAPWLRQRMSTPRGYRTTSRAAMLAMTVYLWHMFLLVAWLSFLHIIGLDLPVRIENSVIVPDGGAYWIYLVPATICYAAIVYTVVRFLWPLEFMKIAWFDAAKNKVSHSIPRAITGCTLLSVGLLGISGGGFSGFPVAMHTAFGIPIYTSGCLIAVVVGLALLRQPARRNDPANS